MKVLRSLLLVLLGIFAVTLVSMTSLSSAVAHERSCSEQVSETGLKQSVLYCDCTWTYAGNQHWGLWVGGENWGWCDIWVFCTPPY